jgi:hypothetical protein
VSSAPDKFHNGVEKFVQELGAAFNGALGAMLLTAVTADTIVKIKNGNFSVFDLFHFQ